MSDEATVNGVVLLILALAFIAGAVILGLFDHPWLAFLMLLCIGGLKVVSKP